MLRINVTEESKKRSKKKRFPLLLLIIIPFSTFISIYLIHLIFTKLGKVEKEKI